MGDDVDAPHMRRAREAILARGGAIHTNVFTRCLLSLYGVGPASVGYILVDVFHAFDELAHISPWEQRIYSRLLLGGSAGDPAPVPVLLERIAQWSPWRALAVHYLWEDLFWRHREEPIDSLAPLIRL